MPDELVNEIESIRQECTGLSLKVVPGEFERGKMPVVRWKASDVSEWKAYLTLAKDLGSPLVVEQLEFDVEALESLRPEQLEVSTEDQPEENEETQRSSDFEREWDDLKRKYEKFLDSLYGFRLHCVSGGVCYTYENEASWYRQLLEEVTQFEEKLETAEADLEEEETPDLTDKEIEQFASKLAKDALFQKATNQGARRYALKKLFPEIVDEHPRQVSEIIDQAKGVFELEIKPELEKALDKQIEDLSQQGLTKEQIAKKLKTTGWRVKKAL